MSKDRLSFVITVGPVSEPTIRAVVHQACVTVPRGKH